MAVVIEGTMMERGPMKWRAVTSGLEGAGPDDKTLVIRSNASALKGLEGTTLDIAAFREEYPISRQDWIPTEGKYQCRAVPGPGLALAVSFAGSAH